MLVRGSNLLVFPVASAAQLGTNFCPVWKKKLRCCYSDTTEMGNIKAVVNSFAFACYCHTCVACCEARGIGTTNPLQCRMSQRRLIWPQSIHRGVGAHTTVTGGKMKCRDFILTFSISWFASPECF